MCGFFVVCDRSGAFDSGRFEAALDSMVHRGPDDAGTSIVCEEIGGRNVTIALGHRRLAIIDLDHRSAQPYAVPGSTMVFNGEIYNFRDLAAKLVGPPLTTTGDTEVLARWIDNEGIDGYSALIGQWAAVHHRPSDRSLILARDYFGKKPLFVYHDKDRLIASSTIKAIAIFLGRGFTHRRDFLTSFIVSYGSFLPSEETHLEEVCQVPPGGIESFDMETWTLQSQGSIIRQPGHAADIDLNDDEALFSLLEKAVLARLVSDRPVGLFVSGGVDSTLILSILHKNDCLDALTCIVGDTENSPDSRYAKEAARHVGVQPLVVPVEYSGGSFDHVVSVLAHQERPFALNGNLVAMAQLYRRIVDSNIKVVLDGSGADEIFGGYWDRYAPFAIREAVSCGDARWLAAIGWGNRSQLPRLRHAIRLAAQGRQLPGDADIAELIGLSSLDFERLGLRFDPLAKISGPLDQAQDSDIFRGRLQDWLWQNDRNSMACSIECRSPFMDRRLHPYVKGRRANKFRGSFNKFLLRKAFDHVGGFPTQWRKQKQGFSYQPTEFLAANRDRVVDLIEQSHVLAQNFPRISADMLRNPATPLPMLGKLFAVAASEPAGSPN